MPLSREGSETGTIPKYMRDVYTWAYIDPRWVRWLDNGLVVKILLFFNDTRMMRAYLNRIKPGMHVWQVAHVYGKLVRRVAQKIGPNGTFQLTDVVRIQVEHAHAKLDDLPWAHIALCDAASYAGTETYDLVGCFFLLHEVPEEWKHKVVDNVLAHVGPTGEAIFVDYHKPAWWQPIGYILFVVNRILEPFAEALWHKEIRSYATHPESFEWRKRTIFGGAYQILIATRKNEQQKA